MEVNISMEKRMIRAGKKPNYWIGTRTCKYYIT